MNPADRAAIESAKANATMARRDAGMLMESGAENARMFTTRAEQQLSQGIAVLGKTGNLSMGENVAPVSGVGVGSSDTPETQKYRADLEAEADKLRRLHPFALRESDENARSGTVPRRLFEIEQSLKALGPSGGGVADIQNPSELLHASGSDLLTLVTTRDSFERDKRTIMRGAQNEAMSMLLAGENYDQQAGWAREASKWNTFNTVLGAGLKIAGMFL